ncbi:MAG: glycosyltransferase [Verrucomicrobia bacterium]|nr:glycosyltransferase [Verrucomicrobiota bacterium]
MRILLLSDAHEMYLGASYLRAFRQLGQDAAILDPPAQLAKSSLWRMRLVRRLLERVILHWFSRRLLPALLQSPFDMVWVGKGAWAVPWLWREFKRLRPHTVLVCYNADNPVVTFSRGGNRPWVTEAIPCFDLYCTYNRQLLQPLQVAGARHVLRLPFAWDPYVHPRLNDPSENTPPKELKHDLVFVGNGDAYREKWIGSILRAGKTRGVNLAVYGSWPRCGDRDVRAALRGNGLLGREMVAVVRTSGLALNILRRQNEGSHNMRTFEAPGCGGVLASQRSPEQEEFFPEGAAAVYFDHAAEAAALAAELLRNRPRLEAMRLRARAIVSHHTYVERAKTLLAAVEELKIELT